MHDTLTLESCINTYLTVIDVEQSRLFMEFQTVDDEGNRQKWIAFNSTTDPIKVDFESLHIRSDFTTVTNLPCLGEIESVGVLPDGFILEGDFGVICVTADRIEPVAARV